MTGHFNILPMQGAVRVRTNEISTFALDPMRSAWEQSGTSPPRLSLEAHFGGYFFAKPTNGRLNEVHQTGLGY